MDRRRKKVDQLTGTVTPYLVHSGHDRSWQYGDRSCIGSGLCRDEGGCRGTDSIG